MAVAFGGNCITYCMVFLCRLGKSCMTMMINIITFYDHPLLALTRHFNLQCFVEGRWLSISTTVFCLWLDFLNAVAVPDENAN